MVEDVTVEVQLALDDEFSAYIPGSEKIKQWASVAVDVAFDFRKQEETKQAQITVRIVEESEICQLNESFRHKVGATNVLSFPFVSPPGIPEDEVPDSLGDLVVCALVVNREASNQQKENIAHWAHMIVHGTLHLLGYDHQNNEEASEMESLEKRVMQELGFLDPYAEI